jgi:hypothetical protein
MQTKMNRWLGGLLVVAMLLSLLPGLVMPGTASAATTGLTIIKYAADGTTVLAQTTVTYQWMRDNMPVLGDGTTHYYHQGPVFIDNADPETQAMLRWNPAEDTNVQEKDMGALRGTNIKDLCNLVGGMSTGEELKVKSSDGWNMMFAYKNVYQYSTREGPMVLTWQRNGLYPDTGYSEGMRLVWFADTSTNPWGIHAFGNWDWHEAADPQYWYYYSGAYPTTTGLSGYYVSQLLIYSNLPATCTITAGAGSNGSITPSGSVSVAYGGSQTFAINANTGYHVASVLVDGSSVGAVTSYTFTNVMANHTISASFAANSASPDWNLNGDNVINIGDVVVVGLKWGQTGSPGWIPEDVNNDGVVNIGDVVVIGLHWGETW